jgi:hypothetical protein
MRCLPACFLVLVAVASCSAKNCPQIGCVPRIEMSFRTPVTDPYRATVVIVNSNVTFVENCPATRPDLQRTPGIASCDANGIAVTGVDLGHGDNSLLFASVSLNGRDFFSVTAGLTGILNSTDCDLVCYQHIGLIEN